MSSSWPFGEMSKSRATKEVIVIAEIDLKKYGHGEILERELKRYFLLRYFWKRRITMQSEIVDLLWHDFILDTRVYRQFCDSVFGEYLDHESSHFDLDTQFPIGYKLMFGEDLPAVWFTKPKRSFNCG
jgi:hypothetical protein